MTILHIKRAVLWVFELIKTLIVFWVKNPLETPAVLKFLLKKLSSLPRFMGRNVLTENHQVEFESQLLNIGVLYKKLKSQFKLADPKSYKLLNKHLDNRSKFLYFLIRTTKPNIVVETGVAAGESTGFILQALKDNGSGKLYSIDFPFQWYVYGNHELHLDSLPYGKMPGYLVPERLKTNWKLIIGNTYQELPKLLERLKEIDVFIHDSEHTYKTMMFEYEFSWPHIKQNGYLLSDDVDFTNAFDGFAKKYKVKKLLFNTLGVCKKNKN